MGNGQGWETSRNPFEIYFPKACAYGLMLSETKIDICVLFMLEICMNL